MLPFITDPTRPHFIFKKFKSKIIVFFILLPIIEECDPGILMSDLDPGENVTRSAALTKIWTTVCRYCTHCTDLGIILRVAGNQMAVYLCELKSQRVYLNFPAPEKFLLSFAYCELD